MRKKVYEIQIDHKYGYVQEFTILTQNEKNCYFVIVYDKLLEKPIDKLKDLDHMSYYVAHVIFPLERELLYNGVQLKGVIYNNYRTPFLGKYEVMIKCLGKKALPQGVELCEYVKTINFNFITWKYEWCIYTSYGKYIRSQPSVFGIEHASPFCHNLTEMIDWWLEGITLDSWNDDYCKMVMNRRYVQDGCPKIKLSLSQMRSQIKESEWSCKEKVFIDAILNAFSNLYKALKIKNISDTNKKNAILDFCKSVDILDEKYLIETEDREQIVTLVSLTFSSLNCEELFGFFEENRNR